MKKIKEEEIRIQIALGTYLSMKWKETNSYFNKVRNLGFSVDGNNKCITTYASYMGSSEKAMKYFESGYNIYIKAVKEVYGDKEVKINWETGEVKGL